MTVTGDTELVYLDHAASTPMRPAAVDAMVRVLRDEPANPTGAHRLARRIRQSLEEAREQIASALEVPAREIVFCGNGSEANNLAIDGVRGDGLSVCAAAEHHAVLHPIEHAGGIVVPVDAAGAMDRDALKSVLAEHGDRVRIISAMAVNNEVGTITALAQVASTMRKKAPKSVLHCDAVQAPSWVDLAELCRHADLVSLSAHKFGGPKGVGILRIRSGVSVEAQIRGGGQEAERRSGTQDVASAVAMATALTECVARRDDELVRIAALRDQLVDAIVAAVPGTVETVPRERKVAGNAHVCVEGVEAESLVFLLDRAGVCASAGSSCASGATQISHVLAAIGVPMSIARGSLRLSLGWTTTQADIDRAVVAVVESVEQLRRVA
jgi:cysteine desulfurase